VGNPFQLVYISFFFIISNKILLKEDYFMYILSTQRSLKKVYHYDWTHLLFFIFPCLMPLPIQEMFLVM
jgi:hypothetical protein